MPSTRRTTWLLLLLAVVASHAALTVHFNSHDTADRQSCQLCTHYSHFEHATPPAALASFPPAIHAPQTPAPAALPVTAEFAPYRQRGPPSAA
ncbi:MAG TPA: hypothetical protein VFG91_03410 [Woeseiaceae bacterium]|nr:hypothetical protein [Woeseiaceae bacterium]